MNTRERMATFEKLANFRGISGHEKQIRKFMKEEISKYADEVICDRLGSVIGVLKGKEDEPKVMICGHMDEVGAMVVGITDKGSIKMIPIGGINPEVMISQNMEITVSDDKTIRGVVGAIPPHISKENALSIEDMLLDIGASSKEEALSWGVKIGQQITFVNDYYVMEDGYKVVSKAWDDRIGCGIALEVLKEAKNMKHPNTIYCGGTVQEEVGLRGAKTATQMIEPDLFIAVDVSPVGDFLPSGSKGAIGALGEGFLVRYYDPGCIMNPEITKYFEEIADARGIKYQYFKSNGGTDAVNAQYAGKGTLATTVGMPGRYIHSTATIIDVRDLESVKQMVLAIIETFDKARLEKMQNCD